MVIFSSGTKRKQAARKAKSIELNVLSNKNQHKVKGKQGGPRQGK